MKQPATKTRLSVADYLVGEKDGDVRHEYLDVEVYAMTGASDRHGLIVEVLSEATERIDRREKLYAYTGIASLREYVLVAQDRRQIDFYRRSGGDWTHERVECGTFRIDSLDLEVPVETIYEDVESDPPTR
ncbi:MAG: Uma2 family endonuclease [Chromatiaceae bacterium]